MGDRAFKVVQFGLETTHGTAVAADTKFLGDCNLPKDRTPVYPAYNLGVRARSHKGLIYQKMVDGLTLSMEDAYFQAMVAMLSITLKGGVTPSEVTGGQGDYLWDFTPAMNASNAQDSLTVEVADDRQAYEIAYVMGKRITISGGMGQNAGLKVSLDCFGDQVTKTTLTGGLTIPTATPMIANKTKLYVDTLYSGVGGTIQAGLLRDWSLEIISGLHPVFHGNSMVPNSHGETYIDFLLRMTLEDIDAAESLFFDGYQGSGDEQTPKAIRLEIPGPQIGSGTTHKLILDLWGAPEEVSPMGQESEGDHLCPVVIHGLYNTVSSAMLGVQLTTNVSAL